MKECERSKNQSVRCGYFPLDFFEVLLADFGKSFESCDLILAALFLWITFFLAARSARDIALIIFSFTLSFFARRMAISSLAMRVLFTDSFFRLPLRARLAVLVTGIRFG